MSKNLDAAGCRPSATDKRQLTVLPLGLLTLAASAMVWLGAANAAFIVETSGGQTATHDTVTDKYWYTDLPFFGGSDLAFVESQIASLNATNYFGISNWHLASPEEVLTLAFESPVEMRGAFNLTSTITPGGEYRFGIYNDAFQYDLEVLVRSAGIPGLTCGQLPTIDLGPCLPELRRTLTLDAHKAAFFGYLSMFGGAIEEFNLTPDTNSYAHDDGLYRSGAFNENQEKHLEGAWVVGSFGAVPIPAAIWLFVSGLIGLIGVARRRSWLHRR